MVEKKQNESCTLDEINGKIVLFSLLQGK